MPDKLLQQIEKKLSKAIITYKGYEGREYDPEKKSTTDEGKYFAGMIIVLQQILDNNSNKDIPVHKELKVYFDPETGEDMELYESINTICKETPGLTPSTYFKSLAIRDSIKREKI